jgi:hypothetical protein
MATPETNTPATAPVPNTPPSGEYDSMASAFDELMTPEPSSTEDGDESTSQGENKAAGTEPPATPGTPAAATPPAVALTPSGDSAAAGAAPTAEPPKETPEEIDWKARFEELEAKSKAAPEPEPRGTEPEAPKPEPAAKIYTDEEEQFLAKYNTEWEDVTRGEALKRRSEYAQVVQHIFTEIARVYGPLIERGSTAADMVGETATLNAIRATHEDYDDAMYDAVHAWVDKSLTGTRKKMAKAIITEGDPEEVVELITEFKTATGRATKPKVTADAGGKPTPTTPAAPVAPVTEISSKAKQAAKAMSVVDSKRTTPVQPAADVDDFEGAWVEAVGSK